MIAKRGSDIANLWAVRVVLSDPIMKIEPSSP